MKRFLAGVLSGFLLTTVLALLCFRYQITATTDGREPIAYRLNRLTGHIDMCVLGRKGGAGWFSISDELHFVPSLALPQRIDFVPDPVQPTSLQP
jgi:hypothetical protein